MLCSLCSCLDFAAIANSNLRHSPIRGAADFLFYSIRRDDDTKPNLTPHQKNTRALRTAAENCDLCRVIEGFADAATARLEESRKLGWSSIRETEEIWLCGRMHRDGIQVLSLKSSNERRKIDTYELIGGLGLAVGSGKTMKTYPHHSFLNKVCNCPRSSFRSRSQRTHNIARAKRPVNSSSGQGLDGQMHRKAWARSGKCDAHEATGDQTWWARNRIARLFNRDSGVRSSQLPLGVDETKTSQRRHHRGVSDWAGHAGPSTNIPRCDLAVPPTRNSISLGG